jgi:hypothetical protein
VKYIDTRLGFVSIFVLLIGSSSATAGDLRDTAITWIRKTGIHGNMGFRHPTDPDVSRGVSFGPSIGLSPGQNNGWKFPFSLSTFSEDLHNSAGTQFGSVRVRALLGGIGYGWHFGRWSLGPQVKVGYAFNHASMDDDGAAAFGPPNVATVHADNAWMVRPEFRVEYFITQKVTFRTSVDYVRLEPQVAVTTPTGVISDQWNLSNVHTNVGIGYYPFRK